MAYLVDTSVLARLANSADAKHLVASRAILELHRRGELLHIAPQNLIEFRNVATRSVTLNGLGLSIAETETKAAGFEAAFSLLAETPQIYPHWKNLVMKCAVVGKQVHDARLVAVCLASGVSHVLTFNVQHFSRLASIVAGVSIADPASI